MLYQGTECGGLELGPGGLIHGSGTIGTMTESERSHAGGPADPSGIDQPHDVLAAEEFGIGARDERLPPDPSGIKEPHDVLAAEEFAMPAGHDVQPTGRGGES